MLVVWLTGRPCSGKTTIGIEVVKRLNALGWKSELLDGDLTRRNRGENCSPTPTGTPTLPASPTWP